ncbi:MAG: translocation/assembly module TamB domain-containing protein [Parasphingopyxis sp.]|uniref:translocation/assembly module TamB domain-containing protein n=1 Tax=Parasphingopyxis sp. TaxID=1920299 RepID=UPI0032F03FFA
MASQPGDLTDEQPVVTEERVRVRKRWGWKRWTLAGFLSLIGLIIVALFALDTPPGRRFIIDQIEAMEPANGMRIRIGRIDGSIYGEMQISDLRLYDPDGLFFEAPEITVDWRPFAYLFRNRLHIESASSELAILHRAPALIPSEDPDQPLLPGFDILLRELDIERMRFGEAITGEQRDLAIAGNADIRGGRAQVNLNARAVDGGDRLALVLDAEPDGDVFDIDLQVAAPEDGVIAELSGFGRALAIDIAGSGAWERWDGRAIVDSGEQRVMALDLSARDGEYTLGGRVRTQPIFDPGLVRRLTAPEVMLTASGTFEEQRLAGQFNVRSAAAVIDGRGALDLGNGHYDGLVTDIRVLEPQALAEDMSGQNVRLTLRLNGPYAQPSFNYRLTAPRAAFGETGFENLVAVGEGRIGDPPYALPIQARATRVFGAGAEAEELLGNLSVDGVLMITEEQIVADDVAVRSDRVSGRASAVYDFDSGRYVVGLDGEIRNYYVDGLGLVDLRTDVDVRPGARGGFEVAGNARIVTRSLENGTVQGLTQSLPVIDAQFAYGTDGRFRFSNARVRSSGLNFTGSGSYDTQAGRIDLRGSGSSAQYGAFTVRAQGAAARPAVALVLANPLPSARLEDVTLNLDPTRAGYNYQAEGSSIAGAFTSQGEIALPTQGPVVVNVAQLLVADTTTTGQLTLAENGFIGAFDLTGSGLDGDIVLEPVDGVQAVRVDLAADEAQLGGEIATTIREGMLDLDVLLYDDAPQITATVQAVGVSRGSLSIARLAGNVDYRGGYGDATISVAGARGREFDFTANAELAPDQYVINGGGEFEGEPIELSEVRIRREGDDWVIDESTIRYAGGGATVAGRIGEETVVDASMDAVPLSLIDIFYPETGFGGELTGSLAYRLAPGETVPTADAEIRIRSLTREGFALRPRPVNVGINARLRQDQLAARAIMETEGEEVMRGQVRLSPFSGSGSFGEQIAAAPLFAELRYSGPSETIWQLTGNEAFSISGPIVARADAGGTLNNPNYAGSIRTENARLESGLTGTVVTGITTEGFFDGSRFSLPSFTGATPGGGTLSGSAVFDLGLASGLGMDIRLEANEAWLLRRDDISARVSGPIAITLQAPPGTVAGNEAAIPQGSITGDLDLIEGIFELGNVTPSTTVPQLNVTEINARRDLPVEPPPPINWELAIDVDARNRFLVRGLGLDSEWSADLEVSGSVADFRILGQMDLVRGGYEFAGKRFELEEGRIDFYGSSPINPGLDIVAAGDVEGLNAQINIGGTASEPEIAFTSTPALPQSELLSRLLFGTSITNLSAPEALQLGAAVASLQGGGGGGLNPINAVRDAIGLDRLRVLPADPAEDRETAVAGGLYVTRNLYVEVITDGQGYSATDVEFRVTRWLSLLSTISSIGRAGASVEISRDY